MGFEPTVPVKVQLISSQSRYDHFDTSPYMLTRIREFNALFNFIRIFIRTQRVLELLVCRKPALLKALWSFDFSKKRNISSQPRYDHFDTSPYLLKGFSLTPTKHWLLYQTHRGLSIRFAGDELTLPRRETIMAIRAGRQAAAPEILNILKRMCCIWPVLPPHLTFRRRRAISPR